MLIVSSLVANAQRDVTKFLGIPVDGTKASMVAKLKAKGFKSSSYGDGLQGEFNGVAVNVFIATNNNKVCRIMVADENLVDEAAIKIRFNSLCDQFENNAKYVSLHEYKLSEEEDISFEMSVKSKRYDAIYYQKVEDMDSVTVAQEMSKRIKSKYSDEQINNPTEEIAQDIRNIAIDYGAEILLKKAVWFTISELNGRYYISMYYDNEYNRANGEEL